jgi:sugar lactone lactonase YvrE
MDRLVEGLKFPEGPRWHAGKLWFSDFYAHRIYTVGTNGALDTVAVVPQQPSGLGFAPDGTLLFVSMLDRRLMRLTSGGKQEVVAELGHLATGPCNDMVVDGKGRAYVGNFGFDRHKGEPQRSTCIVRVDPDGRTIKAADDLLFPNGTVITPDGRTLIVGETIGNRLTAFEVAADGALSARRVFAQFTDVFPDGICLDAEGAVWVSDPRGCRLVRVRDGGEITHTIDNAGRGCYACMLGGADRRTLYVLTNSGSGPAMAEKSDGRIETMRVDVPGAGWP